MATGQADNQKTPEVTTHNFHAINEYVENQAARYRAGTRLRKSRVWKDYARAAGVVILALGAAIFLVLWGYSFLEAPRVKIVKPVVVNPKTESNHQYAGNIDEVKSAAKQKVSQITSGEKNSVSDVSSGSSDVRPATTIENYVLFREIPFNRSDLEKVVVGMEYRIEGDEEPSHQWCYVTSPKDGVSSTSIRVELARKQNGRLINSSLTQTTASELGVTYADLVDARKLCEFE
jgi:hypothetical protein